MGNDVAERPASAAAFAEPMSEAPSWRKHLRDPWLVGALAAVLVLKLTLLAIYGPGRQPDTIGYERFAQQIVLGTSWATEVPLAREVMPDTVFRMIGYPAVLALAMTLLPKHWPWLVVVLQIALSTVAVTFCYALARALGAGRLLAALAVFAAGVSLLLTLDLVLLTDSLTASCWIIALGLLGVGLVERRALRWTEALGIGLLLAVAMLLREGTAMLSALFVLPLAARLAFAPAAARWRSAAAAILIFAPMIVTSQAYQAWNYSRTGYRFVTTGGETTYLFALVKASRHDPTIFAGGDKLDRAARDIVAEHSFLETSEILVRLHKEGLIAPQLAELMQQRYMRAWREHTRAMTRVVLAHLRDNRRFPTVRVLGAVREAVFWITDRLPWPRYDELKQSALRDRRPGALALFLPEFAEALASQAANYVFLMAPPLWLLLAIGRWTRIPLRIAVSALSLSLVCLGFFVAHALIHLEHRYMAPVLPFALAIAASGSQGVLGLFRAAWRRYRCRSPACVG